MEEETARILIEKFILDCSCGEQISHSVVGQRGRNRNVNLTCPNCSIEWSVPGLTVKLRKTIDQLNKELGY